MNKYQELAYFDIISGKNVFITGGGGVGKSYIIRLFYENNFSDKIYITSTTGISAFNIGGQTIHSLLGIGLGNDTVGNLIRRIKRYRKDQIWINIKTLVVDEISMLDPVLFDKLEEIARIIRRNDKPFGGIQLVLSGDFCQLPCIQSDKFCFEATSWDKCIDKTHYLKEIVRQSDSEFVEVLNKIRVGVIDDNTKKLLNTRIKQPPTEDEKTQIKPTILYPYNAQVDSINQQQLNKLMTANKESNTYYLKKFFANENMKETIVSSSNFVEILTLTVGVQVILTVNLDVPGGFVNGSRGVVVGFDSTLPIVKFISGTRTIDYQTYTNENKGKILYSLKQIPLKLAYAISIHKSQGMTIDLVVADLSRVFEHGQGYVCLSRVRSLEGLYLSGINYKKLTCHPKALEYYNKLV